MNTPHDHPRFSFIVPTYRSEQLIQPLLDAFLAIDPVAVPFELVLVDDGSPDNTTQKIHQLVPHYSYPITIVEHMRNFGEHAAVMTGYRHCRGDWIINIDDDLQNPISEAVRLAQYTADSKHDAVYSRYKKKQHHWLRNLGSRLANLTNTFMLAKPESLYLSSFRCITAQLKNEIIKYTGPYPYIDGLILSTTNHIGDLEVEHLAREKGKSNYNFRLLIRLWLNSFTNFSVMPLRIAMIIGLMFSLLAFVFGLCTLFEWFFLNKSIPIGWASQMLFMLLFSGITLLLIGIVGEYVGRIYLTLNNKPQSTIRTVSKNSQPRQND